MESAAGSGLFNLAEDVGERQDRTLSDAEMLAKMKQRWAAWRKELDEAKPPGPFRDC